LSSTSGDWPGAERRFKATAYLTPPQLRALADLDPDAIKGMLVVSTFPDDDVEITWANQDGTLHMRTIGPDGELKNSW
jgi:hypothetical protein